MSTPESRANCHFGRSRNLSIISVDLGIAAEILLQPFDPPGPYYIHSLYSIISLIIASNSDSTAVTIGGMNFSVASCSGQKI